MRLKNIRLGYATNSSSSHSILLIKGINKQITGEEETNFSSYCSYSYNDFIAAGKKDKAIYLLTPIIRKLHNDVGDKRIVPVIKTFLDLENFTNSEIEEIVKETLLLKGEIPSEHILYDTFDTNTFDLLTKETNRIKMFLNQVIKNEDIIILGEHENYDLEKQFYNKTNHIFISETNENVFLLLNNGNKIKFEKNNPKKISYTPELIDFKVTNKCNYNCDFCYQNSTPNGIEASIEDFERWVAELDNLHVFELAVGGGEPLHLVKKLFQRNNFFNKTIKINFTTRNISEAKKFVRSHYNHKNFGAIGVSLDPNSDKEFYEEFEKENFFYHKKIAFQFCLGIQKDYNSFFKKVKNALKKGYRVVLLSFKEVGKGLNYKKTEYLPHLESFIKEVATNSDYNYNLDLDTPLMAELNQECKYLLDTYIEPCSYNLEEGLTSMYIDITKNIISDSSYSDNTIEYNPETIFDDLDKNLSLRFSLL